MTFSTMKRRLLFLFASLFFSSCYSNLWPFRVTETERSHFHYAMNLGMNRPFSETEDKLKTRFGSPIDSTDSDFTVHWNHHIKVSYFNESENALSYSSFYYSYAYEFKKGKLVSWYGDGNRLPIKKSWKKEHLPLLKLLVLHEKGGVKKVKSYYDDYSYLDTPDIHAYCALVAAKNENQELLSYYIKEKNVPVHKKLNSYQLIKKNRLFIYYEYRNESIRDVMKMSQNKQIHALM